MPSRWLARAPKKPLPDARFAQERATCVSCGKVFYRRKLSPKAQTAPRLTCSSHCLDLKRGRYANKRKLTAKQRSERMSRLAKTAWAKGSHDPAAKAANLKPFPKGNPGWARVQPRSQTPEARAKSAEGNRNHWRRIRMAEALEATKKTQLTPRQVQRLRAKIARSIDEQLDLAHLVVTGLPDPRTDKPVHWSATQARVFGMLLNKVVPDLHASYTQHEHRTKPLHEMSRDELEAIASGARDLADGKRKRDEHDYSEVLDAEIVGPEDGDAPPPAEGASDDDDTNDNDDDEDEDPYRPSESEDPSR